MKISVNNILKTFNNKIKLSDFLNQFISLEQKGSSHVGKCPFHNDKTPSLSVNNDKGLFYCFGCGVGGNVLTFISKYKNIDFKQSLKFLCDYLGIKFNEAVNTNDFEKEKKYFQFTTICNSFFKKKLLDNKYALNYLKNRGIESESIHKFEIGFLGFESKVLEKELIEKGFSIDDMIKFGILIKSKNKQESFNRFQNRIIFPIYNMSRKIVGFGGRTLTNSKIKYINSPENIFFKKSENIYGLSQSKEFILKKKELIVVEGYLDVISLDSKKIHNSVASLGTSFSEKQILQIWQYADSPIICFDSDDAGINAMKKVSQKALKNLKPGKTLKFVQLPNNFDPDLFIQKKGRKEFLNRLDQSINLSDLIWNDLLDDNDNITPEYVALIDKKINETVLSINDKNISNEYLKFLRAKKNNYFWEKRKINFSKLRIRKSVTIEENENNLNEMILLSFMTYEHDVTLNYIEEIDSLKLKKDVLENHKLFLMKEILSKDKNLRTNIESLDLSFKKKLMQLRETHYSNLDFESKKTLIKNIIKNIRLPNLVKEREKLKSRILINKNSDDIKIDLKKYESLNREINFIKNKEID